MFDIYYSKCVIDKLEQIKLNRLLERMLNDFETTLEINPFSIKYPEKEIPENVKIPAAVIAKYHYVELSSNLRILYHICESDSSVEIYAIDIKKEK